MVRVAVRKNNVGHILDSEAKLFDLPCGRQSLMELEAGRVNGGLADPFERAGDVVQADARVDECKAAIAFEEQAVTGGLRVGRRVEKSAVQVINLHPP